MRIQIQAKLILVCLIFGGCLSQNVTEKAIVHFFSIADKYNQNHGAPTIAQEKLSEANQQFFSNIYHHFFDPEHGDVFAHIRNDHFENTRSSYGNETYFFGSSPDEISDYKQGIIDAKRKKIGPSRGKPDKKRYRHRKSGKPYTRKRRRPKGFPKKKRKKRYGKKRLDRIRSTRWPKWDPNRRKPKKSPEYVKPTTSSEAPLLKPIDPIISTPPPQANLTNKTKSNYTDEDALKYNISSHYFINELRGANRIFHKMLMYECFMQNMSITELLEFRLLFNSQTDDIAILDMYPSDINMYTLPVASDQKLGAKLYIIQRNPLDEGALKEYKAGKDLTDPNGEYAVAYSDYMQAKHRTISMIEELRKLRLLNYFPMAEDFIVDRNQDLIYDNHTTGERIRINQTQFFPCEQNMMMPNDTERVKREFDLNLKSAKEVPGEWIDISSEPLIDLQSAETFQTMLKIAECKMIPQANISSANLESIFPNSNFTSLRTRIRIRKRQLRRAARNRRRALEQARKSHSNFGAKGKKSKTKNQISSSSQQKESSRISRSLPKKKRKSRKKSTRIIKAIPPNSTFCGNFTSLGSWYKENYIAGLATFSIQQLIARNMRFQLQQWFFDSVEDRPNDPNLNFVDARINDINPDYVMGEMKEDDGLHKDRMSFRSKFFKRMTNPPKSCPINLPGMDSPIPYPIQSCLYSRRVRHSYTNCVCNGATPCSIIYNIRHNCICPEGEERTKETLCSCKIRINKKWRFCKCIRTIDVRLPGEEFPNVEVPENSDCKGGRKLKNQRQRKFWRSYFRRLSEKKSQENNNSANKNGSSNNSTASDGKAFGVDDEICRFTVNNQMQFTTVCQPDPSGKTKKLKSKIRKLKSKKNPHISLMISSRNRLIKTRYRNSKHTKLSFSHFKKRLKKHILLERNRNNVRDFRRKLQKKDGSKVNKKSRPKRGSKSTNKASPSIDDMPANLPRFRDFALDAERKHQDIAASLIYRRHDIDFQFPRYIKSYFFIDKSAYYVVSVRMFHKPFDESDLPMMDKNALCSSLFALAMNIFKIHKLRLVLVTPSLEQAGKIGFTKDVNYALYRDLPGLMPMTSHDYNRLYKAPGEARYSEHKEILKFIDQWAAPEVLNLTNSTEMKLGRMPKNLTERYAFNASVDIFSFGMQLIRSTNLGGFAVLPIDYFEEDCFTKECYDEMIEALEENARETFEYPEGASNETMCESARKKQEFQHYMLFWLGKQMIRYEPERRIGLDKVLRELHYLKITDEETLFDDVDDNDFIFEKRKYPKKPDFLTWVANKVKRFARKGGFKALGTSALSMAMGRKLMNVKDIKEAFPKSPLFKLVISDKTLHDILKEGYAKYGLQGEDWEIPKSPVSHEPLPSKENLIAFFEKEFRKDYPDYGII